MSYKGFFRTPEEAAAANKYLSYIPGKDGKIYEVRNTELGVICTPAREINLEEIKEIKPGFAFRLPKVPYTLLKQILAFFRYYNSIDNGLEALVQLYWDREMQEYILNVPKQKVNRIEVTTEEGPLDENRYLLVADIHSHNRMPANFSAHDNDDDIATRIYMVIGKLDRVFPEAKIRVSNGGKYLYLKLEDVFETDEYFPAEWMDAVEAVEIAEDEVKAAEIELMESVEDIYRLKNIIEN